ncbi:D-alanyl-D-alanine carboxypeptidase/D-alanyl-D-alanine endopeptidase [Roseovarius phycicola]|uniref:D-alanyl-D-alanine carboxypeptidase/D-alanyl-D-alanine-endopeptidase n=1 Tax=Roseovarius phycicola TaxID=3080976 RepID=A0ABZ2HEJ9_9RHOB
MSALGTASLANAPEVSLRPQIRPQGPREPRATGAQTLIDTAKLGGDVSFAVVDPASGKVLEAMNGARGLPPASVTKALTALYALDVLGGDFRFETRLLATGPVKDGVLDGDLILAGGGDPTLDTDVFGDMVKRLKAAGVNRVTGRLRCWAGAVPFVRAIDPSQPDHVGYNPSISGLNLNFNRVHFEWKRKGQTYDVTMEARTKRYRPAVRAARMDISNRKGPVYVYSDGGDHDQWSVARRALGNGGARWLPVRYPHTYATEVFARLAEVNDISLTAGKPIKSLPDAPMLVSHKSAPLTDILQDMLKFSTNLTAELVGMTASLRRRGRRTGLAVSAREMSTWAQTELGMKNARLADHSGLSDASRLTAVDLAKALARFGKSEMLKPILKPITLRDKNGSPNKGHPIQVAAKTGTLYFVSSLAGYATTPKGKDLAFAIFTANDDLRAKVDSKNDTRPQGSKSWNTRSKRLQQQLIERWSTLYG